MCFKTEFAKVAGILGLATLMSVSAGNAMAQRGGNDHHRQGPRYDQRHDRNDRYDHYNRRDHRHDFNRHNQRPAPRPYYYRPAPPPVCVPVESYNYRWNRYEWNLVCAPRTYR